MGSSMRTGPDRKGKKEKKKEGLPKVPPQSRIACPTHGPFSILAFLGLPGRWGEGLQGPTLFFFFTWASPPPEVKEKSKRQKEPETRRWVYERKVKKSWGGKGAKTEETAPSINRRVLLFDAGQAHHSHKGLKCTLSLAPSGHDSAPVMHPGIAPSLPLARCYLYRTR